jgi:biopolymer transport protein ExbB/TolQ
MKQKLSTIWILPNRTKIFGISILLCFFFIGLLSFTIEGTKISVILLDRNSEMYPFTIQNIMHLMFFIGLGELFIRWRISTRELIFINQGFLPEDEETVLQAHDLGDIRLNITKQHDGEHGFLPSLIDLSILQFQSSRSVDQTVSVLNSTLELIFHRVDLRYSMLRYITWVIPTIGFIGTVVGIATTLDGINPESPDLGILTASLGVAFNTTLIALVLSAILVFLLHLVQQLEEKSVNQAGHYTLKNLINRLYTGGN